MATAHLPQQLRGRGHPGFTIIELLAVLAIIGTLLGLLIPAVQRARESGRQAQCSNNPKNIGLAITNYQQSKRLFPAGNEQVTGRFHAWSSYILPFLERSDVAGRIDFMKPWDDPGGNAAIADIAIPTPRPPASDGWATSLTVQDLIP